MTPIPIRVLVTDAETKTSLAIIRSLGAAGYYVATTGHSRLPRSFLSRHCARLHRVCPAREDADRFAYDIHCILDAHRYDVLLPVVDESMFAVSRHRAVIEPLTQLPIAPHDALRRAHDKQATLALARECGVGVPRTWTPADPAELDAIASDVSYPVVIKPRKSAGARGLWYAQSAEALQVGYRFDAGGGDVFDFGAPLIQEQIPGDVHDVCVLFTRGKLRAALTQRRIWVYPLTGGWGVVNETTDEPDLIDLACRLLERLRWHGVAQVEFKRDVRDNVPKLMEINPRFWGTLHLAIMAGMNFPHLLCEMAVNADTLRTPEYRRGLVFVRCGSGLVANLLLRRPRLRTIKDLRLLLQNPVVTDLSWRDPVPDLLGIPQGLASAVRKAFRVRSGEGERLPHQSE